MRQNHTITRRKCKLILGAYLEITHIVCEKVNPWRAGPPHGT